MVSDTDPVQARAARMGVHRPATLRRAWGQVSGERVFLLESSTPVLLGCGPMWSQLQEGRWFLRSSRKLRFYVKPFHFKMLAS